MRIFDKAGRELTLRKKDKRLSEETKARVHELNESHNFTALSLSRIYDVSISTIYRVLKEGKNEKKAL